ESIFSVLSRVVSAPSMYPHNRLSVVGLNISLVSSAMSPAKNVKSAGVRSVTFDFDSILFFSSMISGELLS
ncbi:MAG: hypothetical protein MJZ02_08300, partial [Paludibacteraceae bacterium]|nr:hypothetical protein [Paludibacteraceae bacterium]